jgi:hypothetical protein
LINQPTGFFTDVFSTDSAAATLSQLICCQVITRHHKITPLMFVQEET